MYCNSVLFPGKGCPSAKWTKVAYERKIYVPGLSDIRLVKNPVNSDQHNGDLHKLGSKNNVGFMMIFNNAVFTVTGSEDHSEAEGLSEGKNTEITGQPEESEPPWEKKSQRIDEDNESFTVKEPGLTGHDANA